MLWRLRRILSSLVDNNERNLHLNSCYLTGLSHIVHSLGDVCVRN